MILACTLVASGKPPFEKPPPSIEACSKILKQTLSLRAAATLNLGEVLLKQGLPQEAIPKFRWSADRFSELNLSSDEATTLNNLGACYVYLGRFQQAMTALPELVQAFTEHGIYSSWCLLQGQGLAERVATTMEALRGSFFRPNTLFLALPEEHNQDRELALVATQARDNGLGVLVYLEHPRNRLGYEQTINVWVRDQSSQWDLSMDLGNKDISLLAGHLLWLSWRGQIRVLCTVAEESERNNAQEYLQRLLGLARLPHMEIVTLVGPFQQTLKEAPSADLNVFGLPETIDLDFVRKTVEQVGTTCLFTRDSGYENVLA